MAALTQITSAIVRSTLGVAFNAWSLLVKSNAINKWSKYKPVRGNWPAGTSGKYGLNLPTDWSYLQPRGGGSNSEPTRAGDFRGYEHSPSLAFPTMHLLDSEKSVQNLHPIDGPTTNTWKVRIYRDASSVLILPSDLGLDSYYVGIKVSGTYVATSYRTLFQVSAGASAGTNFSVIATYDYGTNSFQDLPLGRGTYNYQFFVSSTATPYSGGKYQWTTSAPSNLINLPHEGSFISSGSFVVARFIYVSNPDPSWIHSESGSGEAIRIYIGTADSFKYTSVPANDVTGWTIKDKEGTQIVNNQEGISGDYIDIYPNAANTSTSINKTENLILVSLEDGAVTKTINLTQTHAPTPPVVQYNNATGDPWNITDNGDGSIAIDSTTLYYDFWHDEDTEVYGPYTITVRDAANNIVYGPTSGVINIEPEFPNVTGSVTINRAAVGGDVFTLTLT